VREIFETTQFRSDFKRIARSGRYKATDLLKVVDDLANNVPLAPKHRDHELSSHWREHRECHIKPDWLLIYKLQPGRLILIRTGSHVELFG
jgi:mRNA interferase YafQ